MALLLSGCLVPQPEPGPDPMDPALQEPSVEAAPGEAAETDLVSQEGGSQEHGAQVDPTQTPPAQPAPTADGPREASGVVVEPAPSGEVAPDSQSAGDPATEGAAPHQPTRDEPGADGPAADGPAAGAPPPTPGPGEPQGPPTEPDLPEDPAPIVVPDNGAVTAQPAGGAQPATEPAEPPPPPPGALEVLGRYYAALSARDWEAAADCFWEGATITRLRAPSEGQPTQVLVQPAREVFERFSTGIEGPQEGVQIALDGTPIVQASGNVAQAWCRYVARYKGAEEEMRWHRYDGVALVLHEKVWKIVALVQGLNQDRP